MFLNLEGLNTRFSLEKLMSMDDQLNTSMATLGTDLTSVATKIGTEIAALQAAEANGDTTARQTAITNLAAAHTQLASLSSALDASVAAPVATPVTPVDPTAPADPTTDLSHTASA